MAPIEIQTEKPINASSEEATKTTTAQPPAPQPGQHPATNPPPPSTAASRYTPSNATSTSPYAPPPVTGAAAPEARPAPPTATAPAAVGAPTSAYIPPTTTSAVPPSRPLDGPPAPQPGAAPVPYAPPTATTSASLPPPPKAGETAQNRSYMPPMPAQHSGIAFQGTRGTGESLAHPPGYTQNTSFHAERASTPSSGSTTMLGSFESGNSSKQSSLPLGGQGGAAGGIDTAQLQEQAGEAWSAVKGWAGAAGQGLVSAHNEAWKWVDKQSGGKGS